MGEKVQACMDALLQKYDIWINKWIGRILSKELETSDASVLGHLRNEAFYRISIAFAVFGFVPIYIGTLMFFKEGFFWFGLVQFLSYLGIVLVTVCPRIDVEKKRMIFICGYYALSLLLLLSVGPKGAGFIMIVSTMAIAGVLLNREQSMGFVVSNLLAFVLMSGLLYAGYLDIWAISAYKPSWSIVALAGQAAGIILLIVIRNIFHSLEKQAENLHASKEKIAESERRYRKLFEHSGVGISYYTVDGHVLSVNRLAAAAMGRDAKDLIGKSVYDLFSKEAADLYLKRLQRSVASEQAHKYEDCLGLESQERWVVNTFSRIINGEVAGVQVAMLDITERKKLEKELTYSSRHDFLTGLYNRRCFEERLGEIDREENLPLTIVMADLNGLKLINDSFGHKDGDHLLIRAARAMRLGCRQQDLLARIGGDEFAIILPSTDRDEAEKVVAKITEEMKKETTKTSVLSISFGHATKTEQKEDLDEIFVEAENQMYRQKIYESSSMRSKAIDVIMNSLYEKSQRELLHSKRVGWLCGQIALQMGLSMKRTKRLQLAGLVHDIGKIGVEEKILNKRGRLNDEEWEEIKNHPEAGWRILSSVHEFSEIADTILAHHEKWNGEGYPRGMRGEEIPLEARIIAVADAFDAMTSQRSYRAPMKVEDAVGELKKYAGIQFDPLVVKIFLSKLPKLDVKMEFTEERNFSSIKHNTQNPDVESLPS